LDSSAFAFRNSARRSADNPFPARFMKYVSIRMPEVGPFGETFLEAKVFAMVAALFVNNPAGGRVESVLTLAAHFFFRCGMRPLIVSLEYDGHFPRAVDVLDHGRTRLRRRPQIISFAGL
jgi:hypothetical protein